MKKLISVIMSLIIALACFVPFTAFAVDNNEDDVYFTQEEFESLEHIYAEYPQTRATGLITKNNLGIAKTEWLF